MTAHATLQRLYQGETMMTISLGFPHLRRLLGSLRRHDSVTIDEQPTLPSLEAGRSIMDQHVSRRALVSTTAALASALPLFGTSREELASLISEDLQQALDTCKAAEGAYSLCSGQESRIAEALGDKLTPTWTPPGGVTSLWSHSATFRRSSALEEEIARRSGLVEDSRAAGLMGRAAYDRWQHELFVIGGEGVSYLRDQEAAIEASGYYEACTMADEAYRRAATALETVLCHRCHTLEDVREKAKRITACVKAIGREFDTDDVIALLSSFADSPSQP
jgi:hypothetical protein